MTNATGRAGIKQFVSDDGQTVYREPEYTFELNGDDPEDAGGNLGVTYRVRHAQDGKVIGLLKRFRERDLKDQTGKYRDVEAECLEQLGGAGGHAPELYATGRYSGPNHRNVPSILMEYIEGKTLGRVLETGELTGGQVVAESPATTYLALDARQTVEVTLRIAEAVHACHTATDPAVVHRDLNLNNIMVSVKTGPSGRGTVERAVLIDFGQAFLAWGTIGRLGTLIYSAPEIFGGQFFDATRGGRPLRGMPTVDIWSLGMIVYAMRTGMEPFGDKSFYHDTLRSEYPRFMHDNHLSLVQRLYPQGLDVKHPSVAETTDLCLDAFVGICTQYDPHRRFQTAKEALDALELTLDDPSRALGELRGILERRTSVPRKNAKTVVQLEEPSPEKKQGADPKHQGSPSKKKQGAPAKKKGSSTKKKSASSSKQASVPMAEPVGHGSASSSAVSMASTSGGSTSGSSNAGRAKAKAKATLLERIDPKVAWLWYLTIVAIGASWGACLYLELRPPVELWTFTVVATILGVPTCCWAWRSDGSYLAPEDKVDSAVLAVGALSALLECAAFSVHRDITFLLEDVIIPANITSLLSDLTLPDWTYGLLVWIVFLIISIAITTIIDAALKGVFGAKRPRVFYIPATLVIIAVSAALGLASGPAVDLMVREKVAQGVEATNFGDWGPKDRQTFTQDDTVPYPTINSVVDDPTWGDERVFARIREAGTDDEFTNGIVVSPGKTYEVVVLLHNNASAETRSGAAHDVMLSVDCPDSVPGGAVLSSIDAIIYSHSTDPELIRSSIALESYEPVAVDYVRGSYEFHGYLYGEYDIREWRDWGPYVEDDSHCLELHVSDETLNGGRDSAAYVLFELEVSLPS